VIVNSFTVCSDWLNWNTGWWRGFNPEGGHQKWGYILWDNDATFAHYINYTGIPDVSPYADPCNPEQLAGWQDPEGHIQVLNKLRANPVFNQYYITRQADLWNTVFGCENMLSYLDSIIAKIQPEMAQHAERWYGDYEEWQQNAQKLRDFISIRCEEISNGLIDCYELNGPYQTVLLTDPPGAGTIKANTLTYNQFPASVNIFGGVDLKLIATPAPNTAYEFKEWTAVNHTFDDPTSPLVKIDMTTADTIIAHFTSTVATNEPGSPLAAPTVAVSPTVFENIINLHLYMPEKRQVSVTLHSILGDVDATLTTSEAYLSEGAQTLSLDLGKYQLVPGMYLLHFTAGNFEKTIKLIKAE
ncbi:MAG TPA: CotH kinase family protein, partial [Saprospiraceae bacterium]|nr:CotH kinase family protein [Saprospiraceae bacterium]